MKRRRSALLLLAFIAGRADVAVLRAADAADASYQGKPVSHWQRQLSSATPLDRWNAAIALGETGPAASAAIPALTAAFKDKDERVQAGAAAALAKIGKPAVPALIELARKGDRRQRRWALYALGRSASPEAFPVLIEAMNDRVDDVREKAAEGLHRAGLDGPDAVRIFSAAMKDTNSAVRFWAAFGLGDAGVPSGVPALTAALQDENKNVRAISCESLGKLGPASRAAVPALIERLQDDPYVQNFSILALGGIGPGAAAALSHLERLAEQSESSRVRHNAAWSIARIRGEDPGKPPIPPAKRPAP